MLNTSTEYRSLSQEFVLKHQDIAKNNPVMTEDDVFNETVAQMSARGMLPADRGVKPTDGQSESKTKQVDLAKIMQE